MKKTQENYDPEEILYDRIEKVQRSREWKRSLLELLAFLAVVYVTFSYIIGIALVNGSSMAPAFQEDEVLLFYRLDSQYHPGDIVLIRREGQVEYVKRVVAVEGDVVDIDAETGTLLINQEPMEESYIYTRTEPVSDKVTFPLEVKEGQVFVLGDNREASVDSREFGCLDISEITGRVLFHAGYVH